MSDCRGHYDFSRFTILKIKGAIEVDFCNQGKYFCDYDEREKNHLIDRGANQRQQNVIINEIDDLLHCLEDVARRCNNLESFMNKDYGVQEYIDKIKFKKL
jgi:hypothetical protein